MEQAERVEQQLLVPGVPCYKDGAMVARCLTSLREPGVQLLIVDNGSGPDVTCDRWQGHRHPKGIVIRNDRNRYVNPAWNQMMAWFLERSGQYDLLVMANSDLRIQTTI